MQIKNIIISALFLSVLGVAQTKSEDLFESYQSQKGCTWQESQYKWVDAITSTESRKCIDSKGNIFSIIRSLPNPLLIGNINKQKVTTGNSCNPLFGTNVQCLSNVVKTTVQYKDINGALTKFSRQDFNGSKGTVQKNVIGIKFGAKDSLEKESNRLGNIAVEYITFQTLGNASGWGSNLPQTRKNNAGCGNSNTAFSCGGEDANGNGYLEQIYAISMDVVGNSASDFGDLAVDHQNGVGNSGNAA